MLKLFTFSDDISDYEDEKEVCKRPETQTSNGIPYSIQFVDQIVELNNVLTLLLTLKF